MRFIEEQSQSPFCIYGAGIVAASVYTAIRALYHKTPLFFLVSDSGKKGEMDEAPEEIDGIIVKRWSEWKQELVPITFLIATPEEHHASIIEALRSMMLQSPKCCEGSELSDLSELPIDGPRIIPVTNTMENELMEAYYSTCPECNTVLKLLSGTQTKKMALSTVPDIQVFQVKSHMDKPLCEPHQYSFTSYGDDAVQLYNDTPPAYIMPIQAGAAHTSQSVADLKDNTGENISDKNRNYCELTATYHVWKNCRAAYKGICHYRRIFDISDGQMQVLLASQDKWDVILPYPSVYYPDIEKEHIRYVKEPDWEAMLRALEEVAPEYLEAYEKYVAAGEQHFFNFNMLIAKEEVFDDYCGFLFRVLERTEELTTPKGWERADRFAGYLGENLTTLYFLKNREKLKIAYAGKIWLT